MTLAEGASRGGLRAVLVATVVAGALGYVIQLAAPALLPPAAYVAFTTFWSMIYLGVAALAGIQQEVTRAARPSAGEPPTAVLRNFALFASAVVLVLALATAALAAAEVIPVEAVTFGAALAVGLIGYVATAVLSGVLYGLRLWVPVAGIIIADASMRSAFLLVGFALGAPIGVLALLVAAPFGLAFLATWIVVRARVVGACRLDVGLPRLIAHASGTVLAAAAAGVMITGLPMLIGVTSSHAPAVTVGALLLTITLTRAPIVVPVIALQSYLIAAVFRGGRVAAPRLIRLVGTLLAAVLLVAVLAAYIGPSLVAFVSGGKYAVDGAVTAAIVFSAGLVAAMSITGPALISDRRHAANLVGWVVAAVLTIATILVPGDVDVRVAFAVTIPPAVGLALHIAALLARRREPETAATETTDRLG